MSKLQYTIVIVLAVVIVLGGLFLVLTPTPNVAPSATTDASTLIDPSQQGQPTYTNATPNDIVVTLPFPGAVTGKSFSVLGKARGYWFFEASFPVRVLDKDGNQIGVALASPVSGEWMTTEFVDFKAELAVPDTYLGPATLVLEKDNPSGDSERDAQVSFPFTIEY